MTTTDVSARFLQLHLLTFYPPANLNRDDTGRPKSAVIGGEPRLRVSSQALKRAWRTSDVFLNAIGEPPRAGQFDPNSLSRRKLAFRSPQFRREIFDYLCAKGLDENKAEDVAKEIGAAFGDLDEKKRKKDERSLLSSQATFADPLELARAFEVADEFVAGSRIELKKREAADLILLKKQSVSAADIAMFGRMLTDETENGTIIQARAIASIEAAVAVAHAFTTHRVVVEDDFYTAVDDLKRENDDLGASFIGEAGFGAGVFYLYICVDRDLLARNLGGDAVLTRTAIEALVEAAAKVGPSGKRASYASYARTSFLLAEKGDAAPRTLAAAFVKPIGAEHGVNDYLGASIKALRDTREKFVRAYGDEGVRALEMDGVGSVDQATAALADIVRFSGEP